MLLLQIKISQLQAGLLFGAALGLLLGLIPLILGIIKKKTKIGVLGFIGAIVGNAFLGLILSIPVVAFCVYLIMKNQPSATISDSEQKNSADDSVVL